MGPQLRHDEADLRSVIESFKNPASPTVAEEACLWALIFESFEAQVCVGKKPAKVKARLLDFLLNSAQFLATTRAGLRKQFERKLQRWADSGRIPKAVEDQRPQKSGRFRAPELSETDRDLLIGQAALRFGGRVSQAWRDLRQSGRLSEDVSGYYLNNPADKSYVPKAIREQVKYEVSALDDIHHGPRQAKLNGAHITRDWSQVKAAEWYQADDVTFPIYYYEPDGKGWFTLMRGQVLLMIDVRSTRILGYVLISSRNYYSMAIRTLITKVCDEHLLPLEGFDFENGIWRNSKILKGDQSQPAFSNPEVEKGLRDLGLKFAHRQLPRGKVIERVIGMLQDLMEGEIGYVGRDERNDRFERVQREKQLVETRKMEPQGHFYSADEWLRRLDELCDLYNVTPQSGEMLNGLSPEDAFAQLRDIANPQIRLDASCRYLLSHHRRPIRVTSNGITLRFGNKAFNYRNERTGELIGQTVQAWFNPSTPEILCVTDAKRENPFTVELSQNVPAFNASPKVLSEELSRIAAHQSHIKSYYRVLKSKFEAPRRRQNLCG